MNRFGSLYCRLRLMMPICSSKSSKNSRSHRSFPQREIDAILGKLASNFAKTETSSHASSTDWSSSETVQLVSTIIGIQWRHTQRNCIGESQAYSTVGNAHKYFTVSGTHKITCFFKKNFCLEDFYWSDFPLKFFHQGHLHNFWKDTSWPVRRYHSE